MFPVKFGKFQRTPFLQNTSGRLLLFRKYIFVELTCSLKTEFDINEFDI